MKLHSIQGAKLSNAAMPGVRLRVTVTIDIDAADFLDAAEHQKKVEKYLASVQDEYPSAWVSVKQRRRPTTEAPTQGRTLRFSTGRLNAYD
jgi:hypothetical protein